MQIAQFSIHRAMLKSFIEITQEMISGETHDLILEEMKRRKNN